MKYALKEWSTTTEALGKGHIIAIWRKGGLNESFNVHQSHCILFPTFTHQHQEKIKSSFWYLFDQSVQPNKDNQLKIKYWAEIQGVIEIETFDQLLRISNELINTNEHLYSSWNLYQDFKGKVLLLRVYALCNHILITNSPEYSGCKSWVELKIDIPKSGSKPVLPFKEFNRKARLIKNLLEHESVTIISTPLAS